MGDIDFDELDKAVNNLMGNVKKDPKNDADEAPKAKTLEVKNTLEPGEDEPDFNKIGEAAQKIGGEALETEREQTLVEHFEPKESADEPEFKKLGEVAKSIGSETLGSGNDDAIIKNMASSQPSGGPDTTETKTEDKPADGEATPPSRSVTPPAARRAASGRFMDVVHPSSDMRTASGAPVPARVSRQGISIAPRSEASQVVGGVESTDDQALTTPFLPDAKDKVEKRPLGAVVSPMWDDEPDETNEPPAPDKSDEAKVEAPVDESDAETTPVNSETSSEDKPAADDQQALDASAITEQPSEEERALQKIEAEEVTEEKSADIETIESVESGDTEVLRGGGDDDKKGDEKSKEADAAGAIYDVAEYHKPLHPKKQKSGWGKVLLIGLIVIVCSALGASAYFIFGMGL